MAKEFGFTKGAYDISTFRAFVSDDGRPGLRLTREDGEYIDVIFSAPAIQELHKQIGKALEHLSVSPPGKTSH